MAKKANKRRSKKTTLPIALVIPTGMVAWKGVSLAIDKSPETAGNWFTGAMTGVRPDAKQNGWPTFHAERMKEGLLPIAAGALVHKLAGVLGINRALASARVPLLRI